jgi:hypothetical protein
MDSFGVAGDLVIAVLVIFTSTAWPPAATGAFWAMAGLWGIVSIFFDDEIPRGIPGLEEINEYRAAAEKYQKEQKS